jgi:hypothetical membrane protein
MEAKKSVQWNRTVKYGGVVFLVAAIQFVIAMLVVQYAYPCTNGVCYNPGTNPISDLGNTVTSAIWPVFNYSIVLFGALMLLGIFMASKAFRKGMLSRIGLVILAIAVLAGAGVGVVPENTILAIHSIFALVAFWGGGLGVLLLGLSMLGDRNWKGVATYSVFSGAAIIVVLLAFMLPTFGLHAAWALSGGGFGFGGFERLAVAPLLLWIIVIGAKLIRIKA